MKTQIATLMILLLFSASCSNQQKSTQQNSTPKSAEATGTGLRQVIFYTPSSDELYAVSVQEGDENGVMSLVDDFEFYANEFLNNSGISSLQSSFSSDNPIIIRLKDGREVRVERDMKANICGAIFNDGVHEPIVVSGLRLDLEYRELASEFFNISAQ